MVTTKEWARFVEHRNKLYDEAMVKIDKAIKDMPKNLVNFGAHVKSLSEYHLSFVPDKTIENCLDFLIKEYNTCRLKK